MVRARDGFDTAGAEVDVELEKQAPVKPACMSSGAPGFPGSTSKPAAPQPPGQAAAKQLPYGDPVALRANALSKMAPKPVAAVAPAPVAKSAPAPTLSAAAGLRPPAPKKPADPKPPLAAIVPTLLPTITKKRKVFTKELKQMMYGFGDAKNPLPESVDIIEELVFDYIHYMTTKSMQVAAKRGKLMTEDLIFLVRKDKKKLARARELLVMYEELKKARQAFEDPTPEAGDDVV